METDLVLFALTKQGLADILDIAQGNNIPVWLNQDLLDKAELDRLRAEGLDLTSFAHWIDPTDTSHVQRAVETIKEHHPPQALYIEQIQALCPTSKSLE
jgi:hypothetical protein